MLVVFHSIVLVFSVLKWTEGLKLFMAYLK